MPFIVGITGGIGSGKSTVSRKFSDLGIEVIDLDVISREILYPDSKNLKKIVNFFGKMILKKDGSLDRRLLRETIFSDPKKKDWIEALLHPLVWNKASSLIKKVKSPYGILVSPLLIELEHHTCVNRVLVIDLEEELQVCRTMLRDNETRRLQVDSIIKAQISRNRRLQYADDTLTNNGNIGDLEKRIYRLNSYYLDLAANPSTV